MKPRALRPGDTVAFVTPASPLTADKLTFIQGILAELGLNVRVMPHALEATDHLAGSDEARAADLMDAFSDPEIHAVLCTRGGYGCARLFPYLDLDAMVASRKLFLGFSDITTLHLALNRRGLPTVHAPMALTLHYARSEWVYESFRRVLRNDLTLPAGAPKPTTVVSGVAEGTVVGGCLCLLCDSIGTPNALDATDKILLIEDVDEAPHRIDAMLTHLLNSGIAQSAAGFLIGEMTRSDERIDAGIGGQSWREIVKDRLAPLGKPLVIDFPMGHAKDMLSLPLGIRARLDADAGEFTYLESLCD